MTILITGASGQYGRSVTDKLIARGLAHELVLLTRKPEKLADRAEAGCQVRDDDMLIGWRVFAKDVPRQAVVIESITLISEK